MTLLQGAIRSIAANRCWSTTSFSREWNLKQLKAVSLSRRALSNFLFFKMELNAALIIDLVESAAFSLVLYLPHYVRRFYRLVGIYYNFDRHVAYVALVAQVTHKPYFICGLYETNGPQDKGVLNTW